MKQIDIIKTYSQKRCLIVDDVPDIRTSLKRILVDFGAADVDTAGSAEEAIEICQRNQYDMVLADYNLGSGKNGQQLLEELRYHRLLKNTALFVMITAEASSHYVLHALEYQPDDYLNKPITRDSLRPRLDQSLLKNETLTPIKQAIDEQKPNRAIAACEKLLAEKNRYHSEIKKIYGELLVQQRAYDQAITLYQSFDESRRPLWAQIGLAKSYLKKKEFDKAEAVLNDVVNQHQFCVEAHDYLAQLYEMKGNLELAQHELSIALKMSPLSVGRQREMGKISAQAGDLNASVHAYRSALKHSKNSCHESAEDFINLSQSLTDLIEEQPSAATKLGEEAVDTLKQMEKRYSKHPIYKMRSKLTEANLLDLQGKSEKAEKLCDEALAVHANIKYTVIANTPVNVCIDCAKAFMARGKYDEGERLLQEVSKINQDPELAIQIDKLLRDPVTKEGILYAAKENKLGITLYQQKKYDKALTAFIKVLDELPNHIGLNLNLIQAVISKAKEASELEDKEKHLVENSFQRIGLLEEDSKHADRYNYLKKQFNKIASD